MRDPTAALKRKSITVLLYARLSQRRSQSLIQSSARTHAHGRPLNRISKSRSAQIFGCNYTVKMFPFTKRRNNKEIIDADFTAHETPKIRCYTLTLTYLTQASCTNVSMQMLMNGLIVTSFLTCVMFPVGCEARCMRMCVLVTLLSHGAAVQQWPPKRLGPCLQPIKV